MEFQKFFLHVILNLKLLTVYLNRSETAASFSNQATDSDVSLLRKTNLFLVVKTLVHVMEDTPFLILHCGNSLFAVMLPKDKAYSVRRKQRVRERGKEIFLGETNVGRNRWPDSRGTKTNSSVTQQIVSMLSDICTLTESCKQAEVNLQDHSV